LDDVGSKEKKNRKRKIRKVENNGGRKKEKKRPGATHGSCDVLVWSIATRMGVSELATN